MNACWWMHADECMFMNACLRMHVDKCMLKNACWWIHALNAMKNEGRIESLKLLHV